MHTKNWLSRLRVWQCVVCLTALVSLWGCAGPNAEGQAPSSADDHQPSSGLPTSEQTAQDGERFAVPNELEVRIADETRDSCRVSWPMGHRLQFIGELPERPHDNALEKLQRRMVAGALTWIMEVSRDPSPEKLQHRQQLMLPDPATLTAPAPPVRFFDENGKEYTKGFVFGAGSGAIPLASQAVDVGIEVKLLPNGSYWARVGRACGEIAVGTGQIILGCVGLSTGVTMTGTGAGAPAGIVVIAGSTALTLNGCSTLAHGAGALHQLWREGEPVPDQPVVPAPAPQAKPTTPVATNAPKTAPAPKPQAKPTTAAPTNAGKKGAATNAQAKPTTPVATNAPKATPGKTPQANPQTPVATNAPKGVHTIRNQHLAGKKHPVTGVPFDMDGYPDFRAAGVVEKEVKIKMTGGPKDRVEANRVAGITKERPGFTWHHHQDGTTMQLVPTDIHEKTGHTGGAAMMRNKKQ